MKFINRKLYIEKFIKIIDKNSNLVNLKLNYAQQILYDTIKQLKSEGKPVRIIILKARQLGLSTVTESIFFTNTVLGFNIKTGIITHKAEATSNLFNMNKIMLNNLPEKLKPKLLNDNQNSLVFNNTEGTGLNSEIKCMTAGSSGVGRSSTYKQLHMSEYAFWPGDKKDTYLGLVQTVPATPDSMIIIESTPNGYDDFKDKWDDAVAGRSDYTPLFFSWFMNPEYRMRYDGFNLTSEEIELKELYNLDNEQLAWRRWCIKNNCSNDLDQFKQEYPSNPEEAFLSTGKCIFDKQQVINRIQRLKKPLKVGYFKYEYDGLGIKEYKFIESDKKKYIEIYEEPKKGYPYVLGGDTAGIGKDSFAGDIINNSTANQCATLEIELDEIEYTRQMYCLGMYYNEALCCIETNYSTYPVKELYRIGYTNQYLRTVDDTLNIRIQDKLGFNTNRATRPVILSELVNFFKENIELINCLNTLKQALTLIKRPDGKQAADDGYHDDRILSLAIAHAAREQQSYTIEKIEEDTESNLPFALQTETNDYNQYEDDDFELEW
ncbi:MAG: hypothetical protein HFE81_03525 [Bacilli bacterium]|nr:hypothetical protein [Bacilli bacterium]